MINKLVLALLLAYAAAVPQDQKKADPCAELANAPSWQAARDCQTFFPYSEEAHKKTKDTVEKIVQLYVFYDIAQNSPNKEYQPDYDFPGALKAAFDKKDYKNDMEFQNAVSDAFVPLNDAHTGYMPYCYRQIAFAQPFYPVPRVGKDGKTRLMIHGLAKDSDDYKKFLGGEILTINGEPAVEHIWNWALRGNVGLNKDPMTRFNRAVARMGASSGDWRPYPGYYMMRNRLPETETITYEIMPTGSQKSQTVKIPWKVNFSRGTFDNSESYWKAYCAQGDNMLNGEREKILKLGVEGPALLPDEKHMLSLFPTGTIGMFTSEGESIRKTLKPEDDKISFVPVDPSKETMKKPLFSGGGVSFYKLDSSDNVGVLAISTFSPPFGLVSYFRDTLAEIFAYIKKNDVKKLLIELSDNGGGSGCLASEVVALLTPHLWETFPVVQNQYLKDERLSPLMEKLHHVAHLKNATSFDPKYWISAKTNKNFVGEEMYKPPRQRPHSKGRDPYPYTQLIRDDCRSPDDNPLLKINHGLEPRDMAIISNGMCGSACGRVHFHLAELDAVKSVVVGGFKNRKRTASGFPATQVLDYEGVVSEIMELELQDDEDMPHILPQQVSLRFSVRQSYSRKTLNTPVEFVSLPADIELEWDSWTAMRPDRIWEQAAVQLGWVPEWNKKVKKPESKP